MFVACPGTLWGETNNYGTGEFQPKKKDVQRHVVVVVGVTRFGWQKKMFTIFCYLINEFHLNASCVQSVAIIVMKHESEKERLWDDRHSHCDTRKLLSIDWQIKRLVFFVLSRTSPRIVQKTPIHHLLKQILVHSGWFVSLHERWRFHIWRLFCRWLISCLSSSPLQIEFFVYSSIDI